LQAGGHLTDTITGAYAAVATLAAVEGRERSGVGEHVDVCGMEAVLTCALMPSLNFEQRNVLSGRHTWYMSGPSYILRCKDGYVGVNIITEAQWKDLCVLVGHPEMIDDPRLADSAMRAAHAEEIHALLEEAFSERTALDVFHEGQTWRLPFGLIPSPREALGLACHAERRYFEVVKHPEGAEMLMPRVPFLMSATPSLPTSPPSPGANTAEVLATLVGGRHGAQQRLQSDEVI
jgi:crotonobetainyl-CoA:carnitine CoA-transferase CaiB-like acyl-CoA transferase